MKTIEIKVTTKHFRESVGYASIVACPLALALKEKYPDTNIVVGGTSVDIGKDTYRLSKNWDDGFENVVKAISRAKEGKRVSTFLVTLTYKK